MRADNHGEGGSMALLALVGDLTTQYPKIKWVITALGVFAAALFYGDGMITPAISVLSAVEGLELVSHEFKNYILPVTLIILTGLFFIQKRGTGVVGMAFGPIMVVWFLCLAILGVLSIAQSPQVLWALNPLHAWHFLSADPLLAFLAMGSIVLAITGGEALYADMGHFGARPVRIAWYGLVCPSLVLNYFGQGALVLRSAEAAQNPFYYLAPEWLMLPLVGLAAAATVIASQATITGAYSMTLQATRLGYLPRIRVLHTSDTQRGQIYIPVINWMMLIAVVVLMMAKLLTRRVE
jgi:KUP system potassium uptake protein